MDAIVNTLWSIANLVVLASMIFIASKIALSIIRTGGRIGLVLVKRMIMLAILVVIFTNPALAIVVLAIAVIRRKS